MLIRTTNELTNKYTNILHQQHKNVKVDYTASQSYYQSATTNHLAANS